MSDPDNAAEPAEGDAFEVQPVSFGELARWRDRAVAAEAEAKRLRGDLSEAARVPECRCRRCVRAAKAVRDE